MDSRAVIPSMSPLLSAAPGILHSSLVDQEIAHIRRVMPLSLSGDLGGPILPAPYWRRRLVQLLDTSHVNKGQLVQIDSMLVQLDEFEREHADEIPALKPFAREASGKRHA